MVGCNVGDECATCNESMWRADNVDNIDSLIVYHGYYYRYIDYVVLCIIDNIHIYAQTKCSLHVSLAFLPVEEVHPVVMG